MFREAAASAAAAIILFTTTPRVTRHQPGRFELTSCMVNAGDIMGSTCSIIILADQQYFSLLESGLPTPGRRDW